MMSTRDILMDLGEEAVRARGYGGFSYGDLAAKAGIRKASIHHHFPAKSDLGLALIERYAERLDIAMSRSFERTETGAEALEAIIALYRDALQNGMSLCLCCAMAGDTALLTDTMRAALDTSNRNVVLQLQNVIDRGTGDGTLAKVSHTDGFAAGTLAQLQGAQLLARAAGDVSRFDVATSPLRAVMLPKG